MPLRKPRRIDFAPDEWIAGTIGLSIAEEGLYIRICALIYARGGPIHVSQLNRPGLHGNTLNSILMRLVALGKVEKSGDEIDQQRCREELQTATDRRETRAKSGRKGNEIRWSSRKNKEVDIARRVPPAIAKEPPKEPSLDLFHDEPEKPHVRRGTRLAVDWQPDFEDRQYAADRGLDPNEVAEGFRDYWCSKSGAGAHKLDWHATWRIWCRNQPKFGGGRPRGDRQNPDGILAAAARAAARFEH